MIRAVLLDVDGVILDSTEAFRTVWRTWATRHALDFDLVWAARPLRICISRDTLNL